MKWRRYALVVAAGALAGALFGAAGPRPDGALAPPESVAAFAFFGAVVALVLGGVTSQK